VRCYILTWILSLIRHKAETYRCLLGKQNLPAFSVVLRPSSDVVRQLELPIALIEETNLNYDGLHMSPTWVPKTEELAFNESYLNITQSCKVEHGAQMDKRAYMATLGCMSCDLIKREGFHLNSI
jgi:hypothetical protein